jgi:hypothetical protein
MATPPVNIQPELIRRAIDRSGLPIEDPRETFRKIDEWQPREKQLTYRTLERFARKTITPLRSLFLDQPPHETLPVPDFRTHHGCSDLPRVLCDRRSIPAMILASLSYACLKMRQTIEKRPTDELERLV